MLRWTVYSASTDGVCNVICPSQNSPPRFIPREALAAKHILDVLNPFTVSFLKQLLLLVLFFEPPFFTVGIRRPTAHSDL
jgi:hypothetical protein